MILSFHRKYKTFTGDDIWNALNTAAVNDNKIPEGLNIKTIAMSWIEKDRLPLITVKRNYDTNSAVVTQVSEDLFIYFIFFSIKIFNY